MTGIKKTGLIFVLSLCVFGLTCLSYLIVKEKKRSNPDENLKQKMLESLDGPGSALWSNKEPCHDPQHIEEVAVFLKGYFERDFSKTQFSDISIKTYNDEDFEYFKSGHDQVQNGEIFLKEVIIYNEENINGNNVFFEMANGIIYLNETSKHFNMHFQRIQKNCEPGNDEYRIINVGIY